MIGTQETETENVPVKGTPPQVTYTVPMQHSVHELLGGGGTPELNHCYCSLTCYLAYDGVYPPHSASSKQICLEITDSAAKGVLFGGVFVFLLQ